MAHRSNSNPATTCPTHGVDVVAKGYAVDTENRWLRCPGVDEHTLKSSGPVKGTCLFTRTR